MQFVTAPVSGRVAALLVTAGQAIAAGATVAIARPAGGKLEAELLAPYRAIGFVHGTVRTVSSAVISPNKVGFQGLRVDGPVFCIRVALSRETMMALRQPIPLQPGMLAIHGASRRRSNPLAAFPLTIPRPLPRSRLCPSSTGLRSDEIDQSR